MGNLLANLFIPRTQNSFHPLLLRRRVLAVFTVGLVLFNILASGLGGQIFAGAVESSTLVSLTNQERSASGLRQLNVDPRLVAAAHAKAQNIFELQYWSHYGPNGETPWQFIISSGYDYVYAGENLAKGFSSSEAVHSAWMASSTHRNNIMSSDYTDIGIAVVPGVLEGSEVLLVVQMFGSQEETPAPAPASPENQPVSQVVPSTLPSTETVPEPEPVSIKIQYPKNEAEIADNEFALRGSFEGDIERIIVNDNDVEGEGEISDEGAWDYRPDKVWDEGEHEVEVSDDKERTNATVVFLVDTTPPEVDETSLSIGQADAVGNVTVSFEADDTAQEALLISGDFSIALIKDESGQFSALVPEWELRSDSGSKIIVTDELGNFSELDITESVLGVVDETEQSSNLILGLGSVNITQLVTRAAVVFIAILLVVDIVYLFRLRIIHTRGKTLLPLAIWIIVMGVAMVVGTGGTIL